MNIIWRHGPAAKAGYGVSRTHAFKDGIVEHSAEGYEAGMMMVLDGSQYIQSWHASIMKDGRLLQHYRWDTICYHAGNRPMNERKIGVEHEGIAGEPLTEAQIVTSVGLARELSRTFGFPMARGVGLHEHNEVVTLYNPNAGPTACPSGRIPWERYTETEDDMTDDERELLRLTAKTFVLDAVELSFYTEDEQTALMLDRLRRYHAAVPTSLSGRLSNLETRLDNERLDA